MNPAAIRRERHRAALRKHAKPLVLRWALGFDLFSEFCEVGFFKRTVCSDDPDATTVQSLEMKHGQEDEAGPHRMRDPGCQGQLARGSAKSHRSVANCDESGAGIGGPGPSIIDPRCEHHLADEAGGKEHVFGRP
jgi:hypothetical protein